MLFIVRRDSQLLGKLKRDWLEPYTTTTIVETRRNDRYWSKAVISRVRITAASTPTAVHPDNRNGEVRIRRKPRERVSYRDRWHRPICFANSFSTPDDGADRARRRALQVQICAIILSSARQNATRRWQLKFGKILCVFTFVTVISFSALAQGLPRASQPEEVGFSSQRLLRLTEAFQAEIDKGAIPGAVVLVAREGQGGLLRSYWISKSRK